ncbi:MAG: hypothetical protein AB7P67_09065 [Vicinamibacterales bacterium]
MQRAMAILAGVAVVGLMGVPRAAARAEPPFAELVQRFIDGDGQALTSYRARRTMTASSRGGKMRASLVAMTSLDPERGFEWHVLGEEGSGLIRGKVLKAALAAEQQLAKRGEASRGALTPLNYTFGDAAPPEDGHVAVGIQALRRDTLLLNGRILLSAADGDLLRVEGQLVKRPSFWTRRVRVTREYGRVAGVRVPLRMTSQADVLIAGASDFEMVYSYDAVNGVPIEAGQPAP